LQAPSQPADAIVTVRADGDPVATATTTVSFVEDGAAQFDLTGTFAQFTPARIKMSAATLTPNPQCVVAPAYVKVDVVQNGAHIDATYTTCFVTLVPVKSIAGDVTETVPPAFVSAIPQVHASFDLDDVALGASYDPPKSVVVSGANLTDPANDDLPTSADDPRVVDADNDGNPGVTIGAGPEGDEYLVSRTCPTSMTGTIVSSNEVNGTATATSESSILNGDGGGGLSPTMTAFPAQWHMLRVDGNNTNVDIRGRDGDNSSVACPDIKAFEDEAMTNLYPQPDTATACE
jgi:hypothetical protein